MPYPGRARMECRHSAASTASCPSNKKPSATPALISRALARRAEESTCSTTRAAENECARSGECLTRVRNRDTSRVTLSPLDGGVECGGVGEKPMIALGRARQSVVIDTVRMRISPYPPRRHQIASTFGIPERMIDVVEPVAIVTAR